MSQLDSLSAHFLTVRQISDQLVVFARAIDESSVVDDFTQYERVLRSRYAK